MLPSAPVRPIFEVQRAADRGNYDHGWLRTSHSLSFADYYDSQHMNWGALRVFNDDRVVAGEGFPTHSHRDMESSPTSCPVSSSIEIASAATESSAPAACNT
jgi:hypothetical protein